MKHTTWFLIAILCLSFDSKKSIDLTWGDEYKESRIYSFEDVIGYDDSGFYTLKTKVNGFFDRKVSTIRVQHHNQNVVETKSSDIILGKEGRPLDFNSVVQLKDRLFIFSSQRINKQKKNILYVQHLDKNTLRAGKMQKIGEIDIVMGQGLIKSVGADIGQFDVLLSRDSSKMMVYYKIPTTRREKEKYGFHVFDQDFKKIWEKSFELPYSQELFDVENYKVDDQGNIYLLGRLFDRVKKERRKGQANYEFRILSYKDAGNQVQDIPVKYDGHFLTEMQIEIGLNGDIVCAGFYSEQGLYSIKGSYFLKLNGQTGEVVQENFKNFDLDFITQNLKRNAEAKVRKKEIRGKNVELNNYILDDIISRDDGGAVLVGEQYFESVSTTTTQDGSILTNVTYHYNDIIVINISPEGEIQWAHKIPKRQRTLNDGGQFSSYALAIIDDKLNFIFNDHPDNIDQTIKGKVRPFTGSKSSSVVLVEIDALGSMTKETIAHARDLNLLTKPRVCEQISRNEMILFAQRRKSQSFAKIKFQ